MATSTIHRPYFAGWLQYGLHWARACLVLVILSSTLFADDATSMPGALPIEMSCLQSSDPAMAVEPTGLKLARLSKRPGPGAQQSKGKQRTKSASEFRSTATRRPSRKMQVLAFEIGVEIGSRAFLAKSAYNGDIKKAQASARSTVKNLDKRYLHATGIKHTLGKVIIRTDPKNDPLRDRVTATGGSANGRQSLDAFRGYWNQNPKIVGTSHDLAAYHTYYAPSGLAYVKSVGGDRRYATVGGRGATSWANGTLCHEFGHSWGLKHTNVSGLFYESGPRSKQGATSAGGEHRPMSVMIGSSHNIGRLASDEAEVVMATLASKRSFGENYDPGPVKPYAKRDAVLTSESVTVIDVIENDYDVNNDVLDVAVLDTFSHLGGRITLSRGSGPGKRNELKYSVPPGGLNGEDFFHYTVFDTDGLTDFGAVYIRSHDITVDLAATEYHYDFGTENSPTLDKFVRISPSTRGDITWRKKVKALDRGTLKGVNEINQDFVYSPKPATFRHKIANGTWKVTLNMGDGKAARDQMGVTAEGRRITKAVDSPAGKFSYVTSDKEEQSSVNYFTVRVKNGYLDLKFYDSGGKDKSWVLNRMSLVKIKEP